MQNRRRVFPANCTIAVHSVCSLGSHSLQTVQVIVVNKSTRSNRLQSHEQEQRVQEDRGEAVPLEAEDLPGLRGLQDQHHGQDEPQRHQSLHQPLQ